MKNFKKIPFPQFSLRPQEVENDLLSIENSVKDFIETIYKNDTIACSENSNFSKR